MRADRCRPQGFSQLCRSLAPLPASTLVRDPRALATCGLVQEAGAGYAIAPGSTALARRLLGGPPPMLPPRWR